MSTARGGTRARRPAAPEQLRECGAAHQNEHQHDDEEGAHREALVARARLLDGPKDGTDHRTEVGAGHRPRDRGGIGATLLRPWHHRQLLEVARERAQEAEGVEGWRCVTPSDIPCRCTDDGRARLRAEGEPVRFDKKEPSYNRLDTFFGKLALKKPVLKKPQAKEEL